MHGLEILPEEREKLSGTATEVETGFSLGTMASNEGPHLALAVAIKDAQDVALVSCGGLGPVGWFHDSGDPSSLEGRREGDCWE